MCALIPNTLRGSGKNTIERAGQLTVDNIRKERELEHRLKLDSPSLLQKKLEEDRTSEKVKVKRKNRTMLWP